MARARSRKVTIYDVAKAAGVATSTVSRALNGNAPVADQTSSRIRAAVEDLRYQPNSIARSLAIQATQTIGILIPDISNPFFGELVKGVQHRIEEFGYTLFLGNTEQDSGKEVAYLKALRQKLVDGVILVGLASHHDLLVPLLEGSAAVCLDRNVDLPGATLVQIDNRAGARAATGHLIELGHKAIAHLTGVRGLSVTRERFNGYRDALRGAGISYDASLVGEADFTEDAGYRATLALLRSRKRVTAIFASNDLSAIGAMTAVQSQGLNVPADMSVVGFDDIHLAAYTSPRLTTIRQPIYEMGRKAAELLIEQIRAKGTVPAKRIEFRGELIVRESSTRVRRP